MRRSLFSLRWMALSVRGKSHQWSRICAATESDGARAPSVRLGHWRRHRHLGRFGGGLRRAADDGGEQALAPELPGRFLGVVHGHGLDDLAALLDVVDRHLVELIL